MKEQDRADHDLRSLRRWIARLQWFARVHDTVHLSDLEEREREAFPYEWDNIIDRLAKVEARAGRGWLSPAALAELHGVAVELTTMLPIIQRLRLRQPDLEALARATAHTAAVEPA